MTNKLYNFASMTTATVGTGTVTLGAAVSPLLTFANAGVQDGDVVTYCLTEGANSEVGKGTYTAAGTTLARTTVYSSTNGGSKISLSGSGICFISPAKEDFATLLSNDTNSAWSAAQQLQGRQNTYAAPVEAIAALDMVVNGLMRVSQQFGTTSTTITATGSAVATYVVDQFAVVARGTFVGAAQQVSDAPPGYDNSLKITIATAEGSLGANDELSINTPIEGYRTTRLAYGGASAKTSVLGFWVKVHRTGTYSGAIRNVAVGGGSPRCYPFNFTVNVADTWEYKVISFAGDTTGTWGTGSNAGAYINIAMAAGSSRVGTAAAWAAQDYSGVTSTTNGVAATSDVFQITGVSWLPTAQGDQVNATNAWALQKHYANDLFDCYRYYFASINGNIIFIYFNASNLIGTYSFAVPMRATPTVTILNNTTANQVANVGGGVVTVTGVSGISADGFSVVQSSSAFTVSAQFNCIANARL